ncbi:MAG: MATE family efflux transporter [Clostridia bacterium]|nr:MATE family efflux transporter [Clostridia bacterium]
MGTKIQNAKVSKERPLWLKILLYALPLAATGMINLLFNAADMIVVGRFAGDAALAAVSSTGALINLIVNLLMGLSVGTTVCVAQAYGARDDERVSQVAHTSVCVALIGGFMALLIGVIGARFFLGLMGSPDDVIDKSTLYMRIYFCGMPIMMLYNFGSGILRAVGDTKRPMIFLSLSGIVNVFLNVLFVTQFGMDVDGVAWATVISQVVACLMLYTYLFRVKANFRLDIRKFRINFAILKRIIQIGVPAGLQGMVFSISNVVIQSSVNSFGKVVIAGCGAAGSIEGFIWTAMNSFHQASVTFVGQSYGAFDVNNIKRANRYCILLVCAMGIALSTIAYLNADFLLGIYCKNSPDAIQYGKIRMIYVCCTYFTCGIQDVLTGSIRGMGNSFMPMAVSLIGICGSRLIWIATVFRKFHNLHMLYICYPISWVIAIIGLAVCYAVVFRKTKLLFKDNS